MDRDDSSETTNGKVRRDVSAMSTVSIGKRIEITRFARRFERYALIEDQAVLIRLISEIALDAIGPESSGD